MPDFNLSNFYNKRIFIADLIYKLAIKNTNYIFIYYNYYYNYNNKNYFFFFNYINYYSLNFNKLD